MLFDWFRKVRNRSRKLRNRFRKRTRFRKRGKGLNGSTSGPKLFEVSLPYQSGGLSPTNNGIHNS